jgi:radical SAM superfamily enzyme YgiQ (UPF0313 family)
MLKTINTKYVLLSLGNPWEVIFLSILLEAGKKVIVGGPYVKGYDLKTLRKIFKVNGCKNLNNLIIVRPYINKDINFYNIIKEWKDIDKDIQFDITKLLITKTDYDFYSDYVDVLKTEGFVFNRLPMMFQTKCSWGKCSFCKYTTSNNEKFVTKDNVEEISKFIVKLGDRYKCNHISIHDPEFYFNDITKQFLDYISSQDMQVSFFTSVRLLNNEKYWNNVKKYAHAIRGLIVGFETFDDYSLKVLNKGSTTADSFRVIHKVIKFNKNSENEKKIAIASLFMTDLIIKNKESIIKNYDLIYTFKKLVEPISKYFSISFSKFNINPLTKYNEHPCLKLKYDELNVLNKFERIDEDGNILPEDKDIIDPKIYNFLIDDLRWGG